MDKRLRWIILTVLVFFIAMSCDRFYLLFTSGYLHGLQGNLFRALLLGVKYDMREVGILAVVMLLLSLVPFLDPFRSAFGKKFWNILLSVLTVFVVTAYVIDVMHFDYLSQRLNASALRFLDEGNTTALMVWQTYPIIKLSLLVIVLSLVVIFCLRRVYVIAGRGDDVGKKSKVVSYVLLFFLSGLFIFGRLDQYPLRWSDGFSLGNDRLSQLALNPFQSFFSSLSFRNISYDQHAVRKYYPLMKNYLDINMTSGDSLVYARLVVAEQADKPNVVLVICESFSAYKSSMWGNRLNTTPYFNSLCNDGVFFDHCFTPHFGTARGLWATITGIPDVLLDKTASRNPLIVDQHSIINDFKGYEKDYFIGGSTSWANIKGLLENNIDGVNIHEQGSYDAKRIDVWGISDKNLFLQANEVLGKKKAPFFAIIQTSDNHRPYTIPKEDREDFKEIAVPADTLNKYGFQSNDELNAFRYTDFCFRKFMDAARKEPYFNNTIFVFTGDHGIRGNADDMFPKAWTDNALTCFHVPLLFYAPALVKPERHTMISSQVDILPTIAGIAGIPYTNTTLGRDLLHLKDTATNIAFIIDHDVKNIDVIQGGYLFQHQLVSNKEALVSIYNNQPIPPDSVTAISNRMRELTLGYYETARYMLLNNRKKNIFNK